MNQPPDQASPTTPDAVAARLGRAVAHHRAGRLADAERDYRAVLATDPRHPAARQLPGVLGPPAGAPGPPRGVVEEPIGPPGGRRRAPHT
ncbi:tetratricopeptide repeat protein, partial [Azospirillum brasilense]|nr:tetratricopeptide repeat protein [Azospirillum brasilense]